MPSRAQAAANGFVATISKMAVEFEIFEPPRSAGSPLVSYATDTRYHAIVLGRLQYRDETCAQLGDGRAPAEDAALVIDVIRASGWDAIQNLEGEFAIAVYDNASRLFSGMRDPSGGYSLFWRDDGNTWTVGTHLPSVAGAGAMGDLDEDYFAEFLTLAFSEMDYFPGTPFRRVRRLAPGTRLQIDAGRATSSLVQFWDWSDKVADPGTNDLREIAEHYGTVLRAAVRERAVGRVASHLSGGMDSTSVALLARDELVKRGHKVHALCLIYERTNQLTQERPYAEAALSLPGIIAHRITADSVLDFDVFAAPPLMSEPYSGMFRTGTDVAMLDVARRADCATILTGTGADEIHDSAPFHIGDLVRSGRVLSAWSEAARWAYAYNTRPWTFLRPFALDPLTPAFLKAGLRPLLRHGYAPWNQQNEATIPPWVRPDFAARTRLRQRYVARARRRFPQAESLMLSDALGRLSLGSGDWVRDNLGTAAGIHIAHPFRDPRVMTLGLGIRCRFPPEPKRQKPILAVAMNSLLPEVILNRPGKVHFNALYFAGLARNLTNLEALVGVSDVDDMGWFDKHELIRCLRDVSLAYRHIPGKIGLDNSLSIVLWLSTLPHLWAAAPSPSRTITVRPDPCP